MSDRINQKYLKSLNRECNLKTMKVSEMYELVSFYHKEGKTGRIRFPKWLRDLHRRLTKNYHSSEVIITSQLIDILNDDHLKYCDTIIMELQKEMTCATKRGVSELKLSKAQSPNISLKDSSKEESQISSKDETSPNPNIHRRCPNFENGSLVGRNKNAE